MDVELIPGEAFRVYVQSSSRQGLKFLVDWEAFDFNGQCSCEHFSMTLIKDVRAGREAQCKHIKCAERFLGRHFARRIKAELDKQ